METSVNNKCKAFTSLEQSRKLAEILPIETADMYYAVTYVDKDNEKHYNTPPRIKVDYSATYKSDIPAWSLSALTDVLPKNLFMATPKRKELFLEPTEDGGICFYRQFAVKTKGSIYLLTEGKTLVDACVEMIIKLKEEGLLKWKKNYC